MIKGTHLIWADNVWLLATDAVMLQAMIRDLSGVMQRYRLNWKLSPLEWMAPPMVAIRQSIECWVGRPILHPVPRVERMTILGVMVTCKGTTAEAAAHRVTKARNMFYVKRVSLP